MKKILFSLTLATLCWACASDTPKEKVETPTIPKAEVKTNPTPPPTATGMTDAGIDRGKVLNLINSYRMKGCNCGTKAYPAVEPVSWSDALTAAAQAHSEDMAKKKFYAHKSPNGIDPGQRMKEKGYDWAVYGENIAKDFPTEEAVIEAWMKSPNHCRNIMDKKFKEIGLGGKDSYWTLDVAIAK